MMHQSEKGTRREEKERDVLKGGVRSSVDVDSSYSRCKYFS